MMMQSAFFEAGSVLVLLIENCLPLTYTLTKVSFAFTIDRFATL